MTNDDKELIRQMKGAIETRWQRTISARVRCPSIQKMAAFIARRWPELTVKLDPWSETKDRHPKGVRWRIPGEREYRGFKLTVSESLNDYLCGRSIFQHKTTETYRTNRDVAEWILGRLDVKRKGHVKYE